MKKILLTIIALTLILVFKSPSSVLAFDLPDGDVWGDGGVACNEVKRTPYPQCAGTVGLEDKTKYSVGDTILVTPIEDCYGNLIRYDTQNYGNLGQCGVPAPGTGSTGSPSTVVSAPGSGSPMTIPVVVAPSQNQESMSIPIVVAPAAPNQNQNTTPNQGTVPGVTPTPTLGVVSPVTSNIQSCPAGTVWGGVEGSNIICVQQNQSQTQNAVANANAYTGAITINVPNTQSGPRVVESVKVLPAQNVVLAGTTTLPKTGLPFAAWGLTGLAPLGFKLRRFGDLTKPGTGLAQYLWQSREFNRG